MDDSFTFNRTRWLDQAQQTFELEAVLDAARFVYRLVIEHLAEPSKPRVLSETVHLNSEPIFEFIGGEVHLYRDIVEMVVYPFDSHRSALAVSETKDNQALTRFKRWFGSLFCFRINPFLIGARAEKEDPFPNVNLSNFAAWYRHLIQSSPRQTAAMLDSLRTALDGLSVLRLQPVGENVRVLLLDFVRGGKNITFALNELSDGQRCLICLYAILHFVLATGGTVVLDEPENFISLREVQPWLMAAVDAAEESGGQIILISHHPEFINQLAPSCGVQFVRDGIGPVRVEEFHGDSESSLSPAELVARGWENG